MVSALSRTEWRQYYDVKIDHSGEGLIFYNNLFTKTTSVIEKDDPTCKKRTVLFKGTNEAFPFLRETQGGVQAIQDSQLFISQFNPNSGGKIFIVGKDDEVIWQMIPTK